MARRGKHTKVVGGHKGRGKRGRKRGRKGGRRRKR
jgi:hypothetical protein